MTTVETPLSVFFEAEYRPRLLFRAARSTIAAYHNAVDLFSRFVGKQATLADLTDEAVERFCWARIEAGRSNATVRQNGGALLALWRHACGQGVIQFWPAVTLPALPAHSFRTVNLRVYRGE